jgi:riboflavin kinase/FMN adenylyltransferase
MARLIDPASAQTSSLDEVAAGDAMGSVALTLGVFDGVHRGHRALLSAAREAAAARGARPVALVFDPPPIVVIRPGFAVDRLSPLGETLDLVRQAGVHPIAVRFDEAVRELPPEVFLDRLGPAVRVVAVAMTPDSAFGRDRSGTPARLAEAGTSRGFDVVAVAPETDDGTISSSRIRRALSEGSLAEATRLLGRRPALTGRVVRGEGRGRELGYPTANLAFAYRPALPVIGIYAGVVGTTGALVSVGRRPTFHESGEVVVEVHLLDHDGDLYGDELRVEFVTRLRDELRFESAAELTAHMERDEGEARSALAGLL